MRRRDRKNGREGRAKLGPREAEEKKPGYYFCSLSVNWNHKILDRFRERFPVLVDSFSRRSPSSLCRFTYPATWLVIGSGGMQLPSSYNELNSRGNYLETYSRVDAIIHASGAPLNTLNKIVSRHAASFYPFLLLLPCFVCSHSPVIFCLSL